MRKDDLNHFVSMEFQKSEKGFIFLHLLVAITILSVCLPFLSYLLQAASYDNNYNEISVQQFFQYLRNDVIQSTGYHIRSNPSRIDLELENGNIATIEPYGSLIRRQVDGRGHEVYLRDVKQIQLKRLDYGFQLNITTAEGENYEKTFVFYE
ncbi:competence type IV pilus minor pilin ComGF [Virgibacillus oceani]